MRIPKLPALLFASIFACSLSSTAAISITITEVSNDVVVNISGSLNISGLTAGGPSIVPTNPIVRPGLAQINFNTTGTHYPYQVNGPGNFGSSVDTVPDITSGLTNSNSFSLFNSWLYIHDDMTLPSLSGSMTFEDTDLSTMGLATGSYQWTFAANGAEAVNLSVGAVPEPATWATVLGALTLMRVITFRRGRKLA